jgi:hypothetical protein
LVTDQAKLQFLIKSVKESFGRDFTCKLLYRASRDGWQTTDFHRLCDEKGPTVVIVKVSNGRLCGGYCSIGWKSGGGEWKHDNNSFVFSLDLLKKYNGSKEGHSGHIYWTSTYGPWFGKGNSLGLYTSPMNQASHSYCSINSLSLTVPGDSQGLSELTGMKDKFTCAEFEVF